jgi:DNA-binding MarR family transcriptional regulator
MERPPHQDLGIQLGLAYTAFVGWLNEQLAAAGFDDLGPAYGYMFRALADGPATLSTLAAGLAMTTQGAAKILAEMQAGGYVRRTAHPTDARARLIELTPRGREAFRAARAAHQRFERQLAARIGAGAAAGLREALAAIIALEDVDPASRLLRPI